MRPFGVSVSILEPGFFRTAILDQAKVSAMMDRVWENTSEATKAEYGQGFYEKGAATFRIGSPT